MLHVVDDRQWVQLEFSFVAHARARVIKLIKAFGYELQDPDRMSFDSLEGTLDALMAHRHQTDRTAAMEN